MATKLIRLIIIIGCWNLALPYILQTPLPKTELSSHDKELLVCLSDKYDVRNGGVWFNEGKPYVKWKGKQSFLNTDGC